MIPFIQHSRKGKIIETERRLMLARDWSSGEVLTTKEHEERTEG